MVDRWERRFETKPARTGMWVILGGVVFVLFIVALLWGLGVIASPVRGAGNAYSQKNGAGNFISAQHGFVADDNEYKTTKLKIIDARRVVAEDKASPLPTDGLAAYEHEQRVTADSATVQQLTQHCQDVAVDYNTRAGSYLSQDFLGVNLPTQLDPAACSTG
jgi:hypothetical protein